MGVLNDIALWLWRLAPANPILVRVVSMGGKRPRHLWVRFGYLAALFVVIILFGGSMFEAQRTSLADLAKKSTTTFFWVSTLQLFLMSFIAPIFTAGAITQEKDSNTFHILLTTPLSSAQIVLGSLLSRLYFVWVLLVSGLPIFGIIMLYGGVTPAEVFQSFAIAAATGFVTGSLAIFISISRVGTQRTILWFFVGVAVYLLGLGAIGQTVWGQLSVAPMGVSSIYSSFQGLRMSWLAPIHPFLALFEVTGVTPAPSPADVFDYGWPARWMLSSPAYAYVTNMSLISIGLILASLFFVRRGAKEGESNLLTRMRGRITRSDGDERRRAPRRVWNDPIAWREAATRASAGGRSGIRWAFVAIGALFAFVLLWAYERGQWGMNPAVPDTGRAWLTAVVWIEFATILLLITNTAATALTREKESQTMELLLTTMLTSKSIVSGLLRGLMSFALPMLIVPGFTVLVFAVADLFRPAGQTVTSLEGAFLVFLLATAFCSLAAIVGMLFSLTSKRNVQSIMLSTAVVLPAAGLLWACGMMLGKIGPVAAAILGPFSPFMALMICVDHFSAFSVLSQPDAVTLNTVRITRIVTALIAVVVYAGLTWSVYGHMVRSFDRTVRRQSA